MKDHAAARRTSARRTLVFETPASPTITMTQRPSGVMQTILAGLTIFSDKFLVSIATQPLEVTREPSGPMRIALDCGPSTNGNAIGFKCR